MSESEFSWLPDDLVLNIFYKLENNPRSWARLACVSTRFSPLIRNVCCKSKCSQTIPSVVNHLLSASSAVPPGGWAALYNLAVCCPGLRQTGVVLDGASESSKHRPEVVAEEPRRPARELSVCERRKFCTSLMPHLNLGVWNLSREQGNKLLASRFKGDCLYVCDWPGCVHIEEKQNYMLFRGIFKNFRESGVWRTINDGQKKSRIDLNCAFCSCKQTWDLLSAFCLRRCFGYHDDGEPMCVRMVMFLGPGLIGHSTLISINIVMFLYRISLILTSRNVSTTKYYLFFLVQNGVLLRGKKIWSDDEVKVKPLLTGSRSKVQFAIFQRS